MNELITTEQANIIMFAMIVIAPIVGAILGGLAKQTMLGVKWGIGVGIANIVMWKVYNAITDSLGLDTVKNLLVNLGLFLVIGIAGGILSAKMMKGKDNPNSNPGDTGGEPVLVGGPVGKSPGAERTKEESDQAPRDAG